MTTIPERPMQVPKLAGLLARPSKPAREVKPEPQVESEPNIAEASAAAADLKADLPEAGVEGKTPAAGKKRSTGTKAPAQRQYLRIMTVHLPRSVHRRLGEIADTQITTNTALMLTAVNSTHNRLGEYLPTKAAPDTANDLFAIPQARPPAEPTVQTTIRVTDAQFDAINNLTVQHGVTRSELITTAVRIHLSL
ncbi:hypothetical protein D1871_04670 [Nakamurella silvestris]|nr:hypothetical protein D1871_04670 [Nakamurella silvestris]